MEGSVHGTLSYHTNTHTDRGEPILLTIPRWLSLRVRRTRGSFVSTCTDVRVRKLFTKDLESESVGGRVVREGSHGFHVELKGPRFRLRPRTGFGDGDRSG